MNNDDRNPPAEREVQVNEMPTKAVPQPQTGYCPYDHRNGAYIPPGYEIER